MSSSSDTLLKHLHILKLIIWDFHWLKNFSIFYQYDHIFHDVCLRSEPHSIWFENLICIISICSILNNSYWFVSKLSLLWRVNKPSSWIIHIKNIFEAFHKMIWVYDHLLIEKNALKTFFCKQFCKRTRVSTNIRETLRYE